MCPWLNVDACTGGTKLLYYCSASLLCNLPVQKGREGFEFTVVFRLYIRGRLGENERKAQYKRYLVMS